MMTEIVYSKTQIEDMLKLGVLIGVGTPHKVLSHAMTLLDDLVTRMQNGDKIFVGPTRETAGEYKYYPLQIAQIKR